MQCHFAAKIVDEMKFYAFLYALVTSEKVPESPKDM